MSIALPGRMVCIFNIGDTNLNKKYQHLYIYVCIYSLYFIPHPLQYIFLNGILSILHFYLLN